MIKILRIIFCISSFFLLVGCTYKGIIIDNNEDEITLDDEIEGIENEIEKQANIILNSSNLWELSDEVVGDFCEKDDCKGFGYAITDLDEDGFIEVIKSLYSGNGHFSRNIIYEVTEDGTIFQWDSELEKCYSEPDLLSMNELMVCDISSDKFIYYVDDFESWGVYGEANRYGILEVSSNTIKYNEDYREELTYSPEENKASYYKGDIELTVEQYNELVEERNKCSNGKKLKWFTEISYENIMESYKVYIVEDNEVDLVIDNTDIGEDELADTIADNKENDSYLDDESNNEDLDYKSVYKNFVLNDFKELHGNEAEECGLFDIGLAYPILIVRDGWLNIFGINSNGEVVLIESFMDGTHSSQFWIKEQTPILVCSTVWSDHICNTYYKININLEIVHEFTTRDFATIDANGKSIFVNANGVDVTERKFYLGADETEVDESDCEGFIFLDDSFVEAHELIMDLDKFLSL